MQQQAGEYSNLQFSSTQSIDSAKMESQHILGHLGGPEPEGLDSSTTHALEEFMILVQNVPRGATDMELRETFSSFGSVLWVKFVSPECALVRFQKKESVINAMSTAGNAFWKGMVLEYCNRPPGVGFLPSASPQSGLGDRRPGGAGAELLTEAIKAETVGGMEATDEHELDDFKLRSSLDTSSEVAELVRCNPAWNPSPADDLYCEPLESDTGSISGGGDNDAAALELSPDVMSARASAESRVLLERASAASSAAQPTLGGPESAVWQSTSSGINLAANLTAAMQGSHKSIATTARQDLARMAVLSNLAQSKTVAGSPWSSQPQPTPAPSQPAQMSGMYSYQSSPPRTSGTVSPEPHLPEGIAQVPSHLKLRTGTLPTSPGSASAPRTSISSEMEEPDTVIDWQNVNLQGLSDEQKSVLRRYLSAQQTGAGPSAPIPAVAPQLPSGAMSPQSHGLAASPTQHLLSGQVGMRPKSVAQPPFNQPVHKSGLEPRMSALPTSVSLQSPPLLASSSSAPVPRTSSPHPSTDDVRGGLSSAMNAGQFGGNNANMSAVIGSLASAAGERGIDQATLLQLLQNSKLVEAMSSRGGPGSQAIPQRASPGSGPMATDAVRKAAAAVKAGAPPNAEWVQQAMQQANSQNLSSVPSVQQLLSSHLLQEFTSSRTVLVELMLSAYAFLNSDSMREFYDKLTPVAVLYDEMHELPVVQKRKKCQEMALIRMQLVKDQAFIKILQAVCALRHHLYSLSRKVLVMNQGPDGIPIDLLLGSMSSELYHLLKNMLPQEVSDFFGNNLPHPKLAVLVFAEFTTVDPMPTGL